MAKKNDKKENKKGKNIKESESQKVEKQINKRFSKDSEIVKLIKIVAIVTAIMLVFYVITLVATDKAEDVLETEDTESEDVETAIQYDYIMIGSMLSKDGSYYVLIEEEDDPRIDEYTTLRQIISADEDAPKIYTANLTDSFNKGYLAKEANYTDNLNEFRVTGTTLLKISDGHIGEVFDTHEKIKNRLNELTE